MSKQWLKNNNIYLTWLVWSNHKSIDVSFFSLEATEKKNK